MQVQWEKNMYYIEQKCKDNVRSLRSQGIKIITYGREEEGINLSMFIYQVMV